MGFLIRMAFWFALVLLVLPLGTGGEDGASAVNPIQAFFAAKEAVEDMTGICERKPEVCEVGKAAVQTIGARAREGARMAYEMFDESNSEPTPVPQEDVGAVITSQEQRGAAAPPLDDMTTGSPIASP